MKTSNPQNDEVETSSSSHQDEVEQQIELFTATALQRIGGVLLPVELATNEQVSTPLQVVKICETCLKYGTFRPGRMKDGYRLVTVCEVRKHNTMNDCWIVSKNNVYDVSAFLREDEHPGGERAFIKRAGGYIDCEEDYHFHSTRGRKIWAKYRVATIVGCKYEDAVDDGTVCIIS